MFCVLRARLKFRERRGSRISNNTIQEYGANMASGSGIPKRNALPKLTKQASYNNTDTINALVSSRAPLPGTSTTLSRFNPLRRRSKSVCDLTSDLRQRKFKPMETILSSVKAHPVAKALAPARTANPIATKRPGPAHNNVQAKVPKKQAVPSWDFKTRYHQLNERHTKHLETCKAEEYKTEILRLKAELALLQEQNTKLSQANIEKTNKLKAMEAVERDLRRDLVSFKLKTQEFEENEIYTSKLIKKLETEVLHKDKLRLQLHNTVQDLKGNIRVFCRVRPPINTLEQKWEKSLIEFQEDSISIQATSKPSAVQAFKFDRVFTPQSTQGELFEELSQLVQSALNGYNVCIFAYGQTGSGKTYTMQGIDNLEDSGMIPRTINLVFDSIEMSKLSKWTYTVKASFLEIYNENVYDLCKTTNQNLGIRYNKGKGTTVDDLVEIEVDNVDRLQELIKVTQSCRKIAAPNYNARSSRSHAITKLCLEGFNELSNLKYNGSITLVDLAGSESAKTTTSDERLTETKNINSSLMSLGQVMAALHQKCKHIPYRNSKLTYLLQSCLGGNSKTLMIVNVTPFEQHYQENVKSLRFAATVKEVKTSVKQNKVMI